MTKEKRISKYFFNPIPINEQNVAFLLLFALLVASSSQMLAVGGGVGQVSQFGMITIFPASKLDPDWPSSPTTTTMRHLTTSRLHSNFDYIHLRYIPLHPTNSLNCILFYSGGKLCLLSLMRLIGRRKPIPLLHFYLAE